MCVCVCVGGGLLPFLPFCLSLSCSSFQPCPFLFLSPSLPFCHLCCSVMAEVEALAGPLAGPLAGIPLTQKHHRQLNTTGISQADEHHRNITGS